MNYILKTLISIGLLVTSYQFGFSAFFNYNNFLPGEKAAMMGGAYTALSEDISSTFYNPAGLAFVKYPSVSMTVGVYSYQNYTRTYFDERNGIGLTNSLEKFQFIPSTFGLSYNVMDSISIAFSVYQLDSFKFTSLGINDSGLIRMQIEIESYLLGPSISFRLSDNLAVGLSVFYHSANFNGDMFIDMPDTAGNKDIIKNRMDVESGGIIPIIGIKWYVTDNWQLGLCYSTETIHTDGNASYSQIITSNGFFSSSANGQGKGDIRRPHRIAFGIAYEKKRSFTTSLDVTSYLKMSYPSIHELTASQYHKEKTHIDISLGNEVYLSDEFALRMGFFTNTSGATDQEASERIDLYGGSLGLGYMVGGLSMGLGTVIMYGEMDSLQKGANLLTAKWKRLSVQFIIGGTVLFGE